MTSPLEALEGKYEIVEKLREGGMGAVYKVVHRLLEEERVVKVMRPQLQDDASFAERFKREAQAASRLRQRNIAQIYDFHVDADGTAYIVMEFIDGVDLRHLARGEPPAPVPTVLTVASQVLDGLSALHDEGFVHRDVSPDNLMVTDDGRDGLLVKLIDLGIAKALDADKELTSEGEFMGKIQYASPEHFGGADGRRTVEPRSDIYSFGVVLYELLTQRWPYSGRDFSQITSDHLFRPAMDFSVTDPTGKVSEPLRAVVLRAMAKQPEERFESAAAMRQALEPILESAEGAVWTASQMLATTERHRGPKPAAGDTQKGLDEAFPPRPTAAGEGAEAPPPPPSPARSGDLRQQMDSGSGGEPSLPVATIPVLSHVFDEEPSVPRMPPPAASEPEADPVPSPQAAAPSTASSRPPTARRSPVVSGLVGAVLALTVVGLWWASRSSDPPPPPASDPENARAATPSPSPAASPTGESAAPAEPAGVSDPSALRSMTEAYSELVTGDGERTEAERATAWAGFLDTYSEDLTETDADERMRTRAEQRLSALENREPAAKAPASQEPASTPRPPRAMTDVAAAPPPSSPAPAPQPSSSVDTPESARRALAKRGVEATVENLQLSAEVGDSVLVDLLLVAGVDVTGRRGARAVTKALRAGHADIATAIVGRGAKVNDGDDLFEEAAENGAFEVVDFLLDRGFGDTGEVLEDCFDDDRWQMAKHLIDRGVSADGARGEARRFLARAAKEGDVDGVRWVLTLGPSSDDVQNALEKAREAGQQQIVELLQSSGP